MPWFAPFGNGAMYRPRMDYHAYLSWTAYCDVTPLRRTLEEVCDFNQINNPHHMGFAVTATEVATGVLKRFLNRGPGWKARLDRITPDHVLASGALPPGFPMARVNGKAHWDGGLFDNTPVRPMFDLLDEDQVDNVPIVQINLFPDGTEMRLPENMMELLARKMELTFENRFWDDYAGRDKNGKEYDGKEGLRRYAEMICQLKVAVPKDSSMHDDWEFQKLLKRRCLRNLHVITSKHESMTGGLDFSERGVRGRYWNGYNAVEDYKLDCKVGERQRENNACAGDMHDADLEGGHGGSVKRRALEPVS